MVGAFLTIIRLARALFRGLQDPNTKRLIISAIVLLITGTLFYSHVERWSILNALYFSVTTLTTTGFGDLVPTTTAGRAFTIAYLLVGTGVFVSFVAILANQAAKRRDR